MIRRFVGHLRANAVAYAALFLATTGTSVAAVDLANHSINPMKLNSRYIGGYLRAWVSVNDRGKVIASAGGARVTQIGPPGNYFVDWRPFPTSRCTSIGSVDITRGTNGTPGYLVTETVGRRPPEQTSITVYNSLGQPAALPFDVELLCATPR